MIEEKKKSKYAVKKLIIILVIIIFVILLGKYLFTMEFFESIRSWITSHKTVGL